MSSSFVSSFGEQKINGIAFLINSSVQIPPCSLHFDIRFIHSPGIPYRFLSFSKCPSRIGVNLYTHLCMVAWSTVTPLMDNNSSTSL